MTRLQTLLTTSVKASTTLTVIQAASSSSALEITADSALTASSRISGITTGKLRVNLVLRTDETSWLTASPVQSCAPVTTTFQRAKSATLKMEELCYPLEAILQYSRRVVKEPKGSNVVKWEPGRSDGR
ncbi:hypothetical protein C0992_000238, partial [Termitomyces sp. T32_za158]